MVICFVLTSALSFIVGLGEFSVSIMFLLVGMRQSFVGFVSLKNAGLKKLLCSMHMHYATKEK